MLNIQRINNSNYIFNRNNTKVNETPSKNNALCSVPMKSVDSANLMAYHPSFTSNNTIETQPSEKKQLETVLSKLDKQTKEVVHRLDQRGILANTDSNDGSSVLNNLYKIATEPRIRGLSDKQILTEVINALDNPTSITQKFGDIPNEIANEISQETQSPFPEQAKNVISSSCVVASMEFNLASKKPAEFVRFAQGLSGKDYSVDKNIKMSAISNGTLSSLWHLREFNTEYKISNNWDDVQIKIKPDRNAIVRARVQSSYKDPNERSCVDVLIQSALLNLGSQHTYDAITDERTGKFNSDKSGLTDFEKNFVEEVVFEQPKISVVYQNLDENGILTGYNCELSEMKQHILKSLELGENVIVGYTHLDENKQVNGGHEITITGYKQDNQGKGYFICNDTDDNKDNLIQISEEKLLPVIHHAGISKAALSENDVVIEAWREIVDEFQKMLKEEQK
ncbi:MAG: hypothetical protein E7Z90_00045 [Cyanobacteria bacterium SIG29]|nr:hypothetical protein [Cyanobacteria bacterium SIG29]